MAVIAFGGGTLPKGKGVTSGVLLLITTFLLGSVAAGTVHLNLTDQIEPALDNVAAGKVSINLTDRIEPAVVTEVDFDPADPPIWAIRPDDREAFFANKAAGLSNAKFMTYNADEEPEGGNPCVNRNHPAILYTTYTNKDCKPFLTFDGSGTKTCMLWNSLKHELECASFCEETTTFEWAEERPYPHSDCHIPVKCSISEGESTSVGFRGSFSAKVGKAFKVGISGGYSQSWSTTSSRSFAVDLSEESGLRCGYFTFVPVKKVVCGGFSSAEPGLRIYPGTPPVQFCDSTDGPHQGATNTETCATEVWHINDRNQKLVPDGVTIFVYTDCNTRLPLSMAYQDEIYRRPGVALPHNVVRDLHESWIYSSCNIAKLGVKHDGKEYKTLHMNGMGFRDEQIGGPNGEGLLKGIKECAKGDMVNANFHWFDHGYPTDGPHLRGAAWHVRADVPVDMDGGCVGRVLEKAGGSVDGCGDGS